MRVAITGAATGIGAACAAILHRRGHEVVVFDIAEPETADRWVRIDLCDFDAISTCLTSVNGPFDALINNAGMSPKDENATEVLTLNLFGLIAMTRAMESYLAQGASVVSTASRAGAHWRDNIRQVATLLDLSGPAALRSFIEQQGIDAVRAYKLSKEAVIVWSMMQVERYLRRGWRINTVSPAPVETGILADFKIAFGAKAADTIARVGRPGTPEEIAEVICFLVAPESRWINGQDIVVDGGMAAMLASDGLKPYFDYADGASFSGKGS